MVVSCMSDNNILKIFLVAVLFVLSINSALAAVYVTDHTNLTYALDGAGISDGRGVQFIANVNTNLSYVIKYNLSTATGVELLDSGKNSLQNVTFAGDNATFNNYTLTAGSTYYIVMIGATRNVYRNLTPGFPINRTNINFTGGIFFYTGNGTGTDFAIAYDLVSVVTSNPSPPDLIPPNISFNATNVTGNVRINTFCVNGTGTNTSFSTCTTTGDVFNNLTGIYNYTAYNVSGFQDQTILNFNFSENKSIQFNLTENSLTPTMNAVTLTSTANNLTLIESASASDGNTGTNLTYFWSLYRNNTLLSSGSNGTFPSGIVSNFNNASTNRVDGTYILQVLASDGGLNSTPLNSSPLTLTFPNTFLLRFNATNISNGALSSFCVMAIGTNNFTSCTGVGLITTSLLGTYTFIGFNATGFANQTVTGYVFDHNSTIQFNFSETNIAPVINTVAMTASTDNLTLLFSANASDPNNDPITFNWVLYKNNINIDSGSDGTFTSGINRQFRNESTSGNGTYILQVTATDGSLFSAPVNSSAVVITVVPPFVPDDTTSFNAFTGFAILFIIVFFLLTIILDSFIGESQVTSFIKKMLLVALALFILIMVLISGVF